MLWRTRCKLICFVSMGQTRPYKDLNYFIINLQHTDKSTFIIRMPEQSLTSKRPLVIVTLRFNIYQNYSSNIPASTQQRATYGLPAIRHWMAYRWWAVGGPRMCARWDEPVSCTKALIGMFTN